MIGIFKWISCEVKAERLLVLYGKEEFLFTWEISRFASWICSSLSKQETNKQTKHNQNILSDFIIWLLYFFIIRLGRSKSGWQINTLKKNQIIGEKVIWHYIGLKITKDENFSMNNEPYCFHTQKTDSINFNYLILYFSSSFSFFLTSDLLAHIVKCTLQADSVSAILKDFRFLTHWNIFHKLVVHKPS